MVINVISQSGKIFSEKERRVIKENVIDLNLFFLKEFKKSKSFDHFINEMEKLEIFKWIDDKKLMRYSYTGDILVEIDLLPLFRDYQLERILKK